MVNRGILTKEGSVVCSDLHRNNNCGVPKAQSIGMTSIVFAAICEDISLKALLRVIVVFTPRGIFSDYLALSEMGWRESVKFPLYPFVTS